MPASGSFQRCSMASAASSRGPPVIGGQPVQPGGGGQQLQGLAQRVELELVVDPVAGPGGAAGIAAHPQAALGGDAPPDTV